MLALAYRRLALARAACRVYYEPRAISSMARTAGVTWLHSMLGEGMVNQQICCHTCIALKSLKPDTVIGKNTTRVDETSYMEGLVD